MDDLETLRPEVQVAMRELREALRVQGVGSHGPQFTIISAELRRLARDNDALRSKCNVIMSGSTQHLGRAERAEAELASALKANRDCVDHFEQMQAELAESRETIKRLNRRVQVAEAGVAEKVKASGGSLGRALANAAADRYMRERDEAQAELAAMKARIDALMLEFCPDDMTDEQRAAWAARQKPVED